MVKCSVERREGIEVSEMMGDRGRCVLSQLIVRYTGKLDGGENGTEKSFKLHEWPCIGLDKPASPLMYSDYMAVITVTVNPGPGVCGKFGLQYTKLC
jgi:hypothetical protein